MQEVREWLAEPLAKGYLEVTIVGDVKADAAIAELLKTFGALPTHAKKLPAYKKERLVKFPEADGSFKEFAFESALPKALALTVWPTPINRLENPAAARRLAVLAEILDDRLRIEIREKLGETYSPFARSSSSDAYRKYGFLLGGAGATPEQARSIAEIVCRIGGEMAAKGVTQDECDRALKPILNEIRKGMRENDYWVGVLAGSQLQPEQLERARTMETDTAAITVPEINKLAAKYLRTKDAQKILILPALKPAATTAPAAAATGDKR
jgi:zinc protease